MTEPNREHPDYDYLIGSSELGGCIKAQVAKRLGYSPLPTSERMQALYERGHAHEAECLDAMAEDGWVFSWYEMALDDKYHPHRLEYIIDCGDRLGIIVHPDARGSQDDLLLVGSKPTLKVIEVKSPSTWESFERAVRTNSFTDPYMRKIAYQVSCQMVATGLEAVVVCLSDAGLRYLGIEEPIVSRESLIDRARMIATTELPEVCSQRDWPCAFAYLHEDEDFETDPLLDEAVMGLEEVRREQSRLKVLEAQAREAVAIALGDREAVETAFSKVTRYSSNRTKLDTKAMGADGIDLAKYQTVNVTHAMRITYKDGTNGKEE